MEASEWMSFFIILGTIHWATSSKDLRELLSMGRSYWQQRSALSLQERRLDDAMRQLRERSFVRACRFLRHGNFASMITCPLVQAHDRQSCALFLFAYAFSYTMNTLIARGTVVLLTSGLRKLMLFYYALMFVAIWMPEAGVSQRAVSVYHFLACVCYVDSSVHIPCSLLMLLGRICHGFMLHGSEFQVIEFAFDHGAFVILVIISSVVLEQTLRDRLAAQFRNSDAESMISAFRQMLRAVCDGEVLLDDNLRIQEGAGCLNRLLSSSECLDKKIFPDLLLQDSEELERFQKFISQPLDLDSSPAGLPAPCLRLSLQSSNSQRAGVDVYHVALQHLSGCDGSYHLLGLKLDVESQAIPDAAHASAGMALLCNSVLRRPPARSQASSRSGGTLLQTVSNLEELMMLVHDKDQQPVSQIHLKYRESSSSSTQGDSQMPDLRSLIRPTDWETVRASIARHAAGDHCSMELPRIWVKAFDRQSGYVQARRVSLKPCKDTARPRRGYLWLHLRDLRFEEKQRQAPSELADLAEMSSGSSG
ncbi:klhl36 [Symbiodinium sp. CCMP2456]|nr:klhl36 [Symbiodinium sp. CCMP2456]